MEFISRVLTTAACQGSGLIELAQKEMTLDGNFAFFDSEEMISSGSPADIC